MLEFGELQQNKIAVMSYTRNNTWSCWQYSVLCFLHLSKQEEILTAFVDTRWHAEVIYFDLTGFFHLILPF